MNKYAQTLKVAEKFNHHHFGEPVSEVFSPKDDELKSYLKKHGIDWNTANHFSNHDLHSLFVNQDGSWMHMDSDSGIEFPPAGEGKDSQDLHKHFSRFFHKGDEDHEST